VPATSRIHHEQMNRVAAHVEHAQSHETHVIGSTVVFRDGIASAEEDP
jgi:hypothetical protein